MLPIEDMLLWRAVTPLEASARITGKYSGAAPAMTAFTATFSTSKCQCSVPIVGRSLPTISSGGWLVPASIALDALLGRQDDGEEVRCSGAPGRALHRLLAVRLDVAGRRAVPALAAQLVGGNGRVSWSKTSAMNGRLVTGSSPSTYAAQHRGRGVFISGVGTKTARALGIPCVFTVLRTRCANTFRCTPTVGTP